MTHVSNSTGRSRFGNGLQEGYRGSEGVNKDGDGELGFGVGHTQHKIPALPQSHPVSALRTLGLSEPLSPDL